jgi:hypothetical protein
VRADRLVELGENTPHKAAKVREAGWWLHGNASARNDQNATLGMREEEPLR